MGTNASNKKVASKIVAILLAALMLISVMPMTAFAAAPVAGEKVTVDGISLVTPPTTFGGAVDGYIDLAGMSVEITYVYDKDVADFGEKAPLNDYVITYTTLAQFIDALDDFGVKCNYADYVDGSAAKKKLSLDNNTLSLQFTYSKDATKVWDTELYPVVTPNRWESASKINIYSDGNYIVVINDKAVLSNKAVDTTLISGALSENALSVQPMTIDSVADIIKNWTAQIKALNEGKKTEDEIKGTDLIWTADFDLADGVYSVELNNGAIALSNKEVDENVIAKNEWALVGASNAVELMYVDGNLYFPRDEVQTSVNGTVIDTVTVPYYVAQAEAGYLYLTKDATKAAKVDFYKLGGYTAASVEKIEIVTDATKMEYNEGESFNADGMTVNLVYTDGTVLCVPSTHFKALGISVSINGIVLNNKGENTNYKLTETENDQYVKAYVGGVYDMSNKVLKVKTGEQNSFVLTDGELTTGLYAIVWYEGADKLVANTTYTGTALTARDIPFVRYNYAASDYVASTLKGETVTFRNNALGTDKGDVFVNGDNTTVWQVTAVGAKYTISVPGTTTYLNRVSVNKYDNWALAGNTVSSEFDAKDDMILVLGELCADSYWDIDGTYDAAIESFTTVSTADNYYVSLDGNAFIADVNGDDQDDENFFFFKTESAVTAKAIKIIDQAYATYKTGEKLDLSDLVVMVTYSNGKTVEVAYDDFNTYGITVNYANGATITGADNGKNIVVSIGDLNATGAALNVTDSKADVTSVRLGGADRYATAALIAESYVTALGADYANVAVLTSGTNYPDALAGATLANALKAPIVLTKGDALVDVTKTFLTSKAVKTVYIIGGTSAVSANVEATLKTMGIAVVRVEGTDRVETSLAVAKELAKIKGYNNTIILTNGANFADALSVSSAAAQKAIPVVYVNNTLSESTKAFIAEAKATNAIILGGDAAVSADVEAAVKALGLSVERIKGDDRFQTSVAIAERFADVYTGKAVAFATGKDFPDALAGSVYAAFLGAPVVLLENGGENSVAGAYTAGLELTNVYVFGGEDALNTASVNNALLK